MTTVRVNPYSQVTYQTNRYSLLVNRARREVILKAYPFTIEIWDGMHLVATHPRSYERNLDLLDPLHYLPLLEQKPGAFDYAKPLKEWRHRWPLSYHRMLALLREKWLGGQGVQEFVRILQLHQTYPARKWNKLSKRHGPWAVSTWMGSSRGQHIQFHVISTSVERKERTQRQR